MKFKMLLFFIFTLFTIVVFGNDIIVEGRIELPENNTKLPLTLMNIEPEGTRTIPVYPDLTGKFQFSGSFQGEYNLEVWENSLSNKPIKYNLSITSYPNEIFKDHFDSITFRNEEIKTEVLNFYTYNDALKKYIVNDNLTKSDISLLNDAFFNSDFIKKIELAPLSLPYN